MEATVTIDEPLTKGERERIRRWTRRWNERCWDQYLVFLYGNTLGITAEEYDLTAMGLSPRALPHRVARQAMLAAHRTFRYAVA